MAARGAALFTTARPLRGILLLWIIAASAGCSKEQRTLAMEQPVTPPTSNHDPREARYAGNAYQVAQGGRYFTWYGCGGCHGYAAQGALDLRDGIWKQTGSLTGIYAMLARGHGGAPPIPDEQLWQITAYVRDLPNWSFEQRRRQDLDQAAEPQGAAWTGPRL